LKEEQMGMLFSINPSGDARDLPARIEQTAGALKVHETATLIGVSRSSMYQQLLSGALPYSRLPSGAIRIDPARLAAWLREREVAFPERKAA
jgi:predicted DNA-binding transcriptional regulator AlpA